jgi:hypothetical protein
MQSGSQWQSARRSQTWRKPAEDVGARGGLRGAERTRFVANEDGCGIGKAEAGDREVFAAADTSRRVAVDDAAEVAPAGAA